ncbi:MULTISPECIES: hypothetical protein [Flavobacteriales]|jgi:hypothetical protein|uniref:hypothetical protein n=1 Tax=Flavobacteriales TaxID=200644 RepID=UPI0023E7F520|nr:MULTISPECIES: hypothetical protein [Chryseobacterium]WET51435.1 hypothetical protein PYS58_09880 [Chryseobacterium indologenes]
MRKLFFTLIIIFLSTILTFAQSSSEAPHQNISMDSNVVYRLFATKNMYNFIKLNTRNGQMWQVQWSTGDNTFQVPLSLTPLVLSEEEKNGRFFLYPTTNIYNFLLLDQIDGRAWQVQWSIEEKDRMIIRIY